MTRQATPLDPLQIEPESSSVSSSSTTTTIVIDSEADRTPRRSVRLMKRRRDNDDCDEGNSTENTENTRNNVNTDNTFSTSTENTGNTSADNTCSTSTENTGNTSADNTCSTSADNTCITSTSTRNEPTSRTTNTEPSSSSSLPSIPVMPNIGHFSPQMSMVFSIGLPRNSNPTSTSTSDLLPDNIRIFNSATTGISTNIMESISGGMRITSFIVPQISSTSAQPGTPASTNSTNAFSNTELLNVARQMAQIVERAHSTTPSSSGTGIELIHLPFRDFIGNITELMGQSVAITASSTTGTSIDASILADELEPLLNELVRRTFGNLGSVPTGLTPDRINALPIMTTGGGEEFDCAVCRETARVGAEKCVKLPCDHSFHFECIEPWLKRVSSCPICRAVIKEEQE